MGNKVTIVAEAGINHQGNIDIAKKLINAAAAAGADYIKLQKRDSSMICEQHRDLYRIRETPWGNITHLEYRRKLEFGEKEYDEIAKHCERAGIRWFLSVWDEPSIDFALRYEPDYIKLPSALLTAHDLIKRIVSSGVPLILSTGMSTWNEIHGAAAAARQVGRIERWLLHCHSAYPAPTEELNLNVIRKLMTEFPTWCIGYSGHEKHGEPSVVAVVLGARMVERHLTLDRAMWGSDHQSSLEPTAFLQLVRRIRSVETMLGDGMKRLWDSEKVALEKLRPPEYRS